jgi:hypothetical protein
MTFRITGLDPVPFRPLFGLPEEDLARLGVLRFVVDSTPGETVLLLNHECQPARSPYRARHAIYVREFAQAAYDCVGEVPEVMRARLLSLRGYDTRGMIVDADVVEGRDIEALIDRLFDQPAIAYIHAHNAKRGCYSGRIDRG